MPDKGPGAAESTVNNSKGLLHKGLCGGGSVDTATRSQPTPLTAMRAVKDAQGAVSAGTSGSRSLPGARCV